jgi:hypothetical protein
LEKFTGVLPETFKLSKPIEHFNYALKLMHDLEKAKRLIITRKENGWKVLVCINNNYDITFFTDGLNEIARIKIDHIRNELGMLTKIMLPPNTLLVGEVVGNGKTDDRGRVISLMSSKDPSEVLKMLKTGPLPHLRLFNIIFMNGKVFDVTYEEVHKRLTSMTRGLKYLQPVELLKCTFDEAMARALKEGWEGLVLYDKEFKITFRNDGKSDPKRPYGSWKWKPQNEEDFIALGCRMRDNDPNTVKDLKLYQIDPINGKYMRCIHYGSFTRVDREKFSRLPMQKQTAKRGKKVVTGWFETPFVCQLTHDARKEKTGKLEGAREFLVREDKKPEECFAPQTYPEAEYLDTTVLTAK